MKIIKTTINTLFMVSLPLLLAFNNVKAVCQNGQLPDPFNPDCKGNPPSIGDLISKVLAVIPPLIGVVLFGVLIWGAFQVFMSGPNDDAKKKGFQTIQNAITGVLILIFSVAIITILEAVLGVKILYGVMLKS